MTGSLEHLFSPRSVAIFGASSDATRISGRPVRYLKEGGFAGRIFPINPGRAEVQGLPSFPSIGAIGDPVDAAIIALPPDAAMEAARAAAAHGVRQLVMFSAGFAETDAAGQARQAELKALSRQNGMRVLGPNCLGSYSVHSGAYLTFSGVFDDVNGTRGRFGMVSQSGGYAGEVLKHARGRGIEFGTWVTTGNEADIEFGEVLSALAQNPDVDAIVGYIEGIRAAGPFLDGLEAARRARKPVILLKVGRTATGAEAAASHTAALAGADEIYDMVFEEYGVHRARTTEDMLDVAYALRRGIYPPGRRLAIVTNSGGLGIQAADYASDDDLAVPPTPAQAQAAIMEQLPNASARNPVDTTGQVANEPEKLGFAVETMLATGAYDAAYVNIGLIGGLPFLADRLVRVFQQVAQAQPDTLIAVTVTAPPEVVAAYDAAGLLTFGEPARAIRAIAALAGIRRAWDRPVPAAVPSDNPPPALAMRGALSEVEAKHVLSAIGIPCPPEVLARDAAQAAAHAAPLGGSFAVKVVSADIGHKTDVGGVALNVPAASVERVVSEMDATVRAAAPGARIDGYLVTPMVSGGVECLVGVHNDPVFGPVVMFGLGGVAVELYKDVVVRPVPVSLDEARAMIRGIRGFPLLDGFRGAPPADIEALAGAITAIAGLAQANRETVQTIEVNPLRVMPRGKGVLALDAVIETRGAGRTTHL